MFTPRSWLAGIVTVALLAAGSATPVRAAEAPPRTTDSHWFVYSAGQGVDAQGIIRVARRWAGLDGQPGVPESVTAGDVSVMPFGSSKTFRPTTTSVRVTIVDLGIPPGLPTDLSVYQGSKRLLGTCVPNGSTTRLNVQKGVPLELVIDGARYTRPVIGCWPTAGVIRIEEG